MADNKRFGVFGDKGSFSEEAGIVYAQSAGITAPFIYLPKMEDVLAAVDLGQIDIGLFPVINFRGGLVMAAFEAMGKYPFSLIDSVWLNVQHCLIIQPGASLENITKVVSHTQALTQCGKYLRREFGHAEQVAWESTAGAAKDLAEGRLSSSCAVIASERAAGIYKLEVAAKSIQDDPSNQTVFIVVEKLNSRE